MKTLQKIIVSVLITSVSLFAAPAAPGVKTFIQADGTSFQGILKGDAFFNWIESYGDVVVYNAEDKSYYKAIVDTNKGLLQSSQKVEQKSSSLSPSASAKIKMSEHEVSSDMKEKLKTMYNKNHSNF